MKWVIYIAILFPLCSQANSLINTDRPFHQGYNPSTQRMLNLMRIQQQDQQIKLQQEQRDQAQQRSAQIRLKKPGGTSNNN